MQFEQEPHQISLDTEITNTGLLLLGGTPEYWVVDEMEPEQEIFVLFLKQVDSIVGAYTQLFLSTSREELSTTYAQFEGNSFKEMTNILIFEGKLHCFDVSFVQQFLLFLLKWSVSQGSTHKEMQGVITELLKKTQDYEPVPTGSPLLPVQLHSWFNTGIFATYFDEVCCVSYEVMMTLKYALSQLLSLSLSTFQYVSWIKTNQGCQIIWKTFPDNLDKIEYKLRLFPSTAALRVKGFVPYNIEFTCSIENKQILLDGSPLLYPDLDGEIKYICVYMHTYICVYMHTYIYIHIIHVHTLGFSNNVELSNSST